MKLPRWIPRTIRPSDMGGYGVVWDNMSDNERRWSFLIDVAIFVVFGSGFALFLWSMT